MKKAFVIVAGFIFILILQSVSIWDQTTFFDNAIHVGDILRVHFLEKRIQTFERKLKSSENQNLAGKTMTGEAWGFLPLSSLTQNDNTASQRSLSLKQMQDFYISVKIAAITNQQVYVEGRSSTLINGEVMEMILKGESDLYRIKSDKSLYSHDLYNLRFEMNSRVEEDKSVLNMNDLIFETNYAQIQTNRVFQNGITNTSYLTNESSLSLKFKGIQDQKKKEMVLFYINAMIKNLFY